MFPRRLSENTRFACAIQGLLEKFQHFAAILAKVDVISFDLGSVACYLEVFFLILLAEWRYFQIRDGLIPSKWPWRFF